MAACVQCYCSIHVDSVVQNTADLIAICSDSAYILHYNSIVIMNATDPLTIDELLAEGVANNWFYIQSKYSRYFVTYSQGADSGIVVDPFTVTEAPFQQVCHLSPHFTFIEPGTSSAVEVSCHQGPGPL
jgi:hypothetical protein